MNYASPRALRTPVKDTKPALDFRSDGSLTIRTGCTTGGSTWKADGTALTITPVASTLIGCPEPLADQKAAIFAALPRTASVQRGDIDAVFLDDDDDALFVLEKDA